MAGIDPLFLRTGSVGVFDRIARVYDRANRVLSFGQDIRWRDSIKDWLPSSGSLAVLDIACGTADMALTLLKSRSAACRVTGIDLCDHMLDIGRIKADRSGHLRQISFVRADAQNLPFSDQSFDVVTVAFGLRNMPNYVRVLAGAHRVLKSNGQLIVLELVLPGKSNILYPLVRFYIRFLVPFIGGLFTGQPQAYRYLAQTIEHFSDGQRFEQILEQTGFRVSARKHFMFGVARLWLAEKAASAMTGQAW
jgi:demethylmenaquinone methyltransferase/2-methoxy-6-polyprenyl-1,4-benzoquinol methylase